MRTAPLVLALAASACSFGGSTGIAVDAAAPDSPPIDGVPPPIDAPTDAALPAWGPPVLVISLASIGIDDDPSLTDDQLLMVFASNREGSEDIYMSTRASIDDPWEPPVVIPELRSAATDSNVDISADGLALTFTSFRDSLTADLYSSRRDHRTDPWSVPALIPGTKLSATSNEYGAQLASDGRSIYFCGNQGTDEKIYYARRKNVGLPFDPPFVPGGIDGPTTDECDIWVVGDSIYFTSDRAGSIDIYTAERTSGAPFEYSNVRRIDELALSDVDGDPWVSSDQRTMYFASDRAGSSDIYMSTR